MTQAGILLERVSRPFGDRLAVDDVSLAVSAGSIHALLGPNGAGKTTLLRILCGLVDPDSGNVTVGGVDSRLDSIGVRRHIGFVPSGDRSFYLRLSGFENLVFFARLHGLARREAGRRAVEALDEVGLATAARQRVGEYSHGMHKRLSVARALLLRPPVLLIDEATHDLDPNGTAQVQHLVRAAAADGAAVLWATQRLDEIRDFADAVTLLHRGQVRFAGSVPALMALAAGTRYVLQLGGDTKRAREAAASVNADGDLRPAAGEAAGHWVLELGDRAVFGEVVAALQARGVDVLACREQESDLYSAFLQLTAEG